MVRWFVQGESRPSKKERKRQEEGKHGVLAENGMMITGRCRKHLFTQAPL